MEGPRLSGKFYSRNVYIFKSGFAVNGRIFSCYDNKVRSVVWRRKRNFFFSFFRRTHAGDYSVESFGLDGGDKPVPGIGVNFELISESFGYFKSYLYVVAVCIFPCVISYRIAAVFIVVLRPVKRRIVAFHTDFKGFCGR